MVNIKATQVRKGKVLVFDGQLYVVTEYEHRKPGKGPAFNQVVCKHFKTGAQKRMKLSSDDVVEQAYLESRECTYSYPEGDNFVFIDLENYEQHYLSAELVKDQMKYVKDNLAVIITFFESNPITLVLPKSVVLKVQEAEIAAKGDTVTNDKKGAVCETGLEVRVPGYIEAGEYIKINTENGDFLQRAKEEEA
ncbi:MAG: elongation factor P [Planctomycetota bacterium]|jgi:elongation factor P|nr:elongation factor P [Planctomycetota bacterium]